jgi:radical SAM superfamily enzyme YgiQ (UPF0313 family)
MKVLFIYNRFESLAIEVLSSFLKAHGHEVALAFDPQLFNDGYLNIKFLSKKYDFTHKILKRVKDVQPDLICFSVLTDNYRWALKFAYLIKERFSVPIVFGGIHVSSVPDEVISHNFIDFAIVGEGEFALLELTEALEKNKDFSKIRNLVYRISGKIVKNKIRNLIKDLDKQPFPDKELFYNLIPYSRETYCVMTGRGCPFSCTYCFNNIYKKIYAKKGKYLRKRRVHNVIQELKEAKMKYNYKFVSILDDVFMVDDSWLREFCKKYSHEIKVPFRCIGHVNYINEQNIALLKKAGCEIIQIGVQTTCDYTRKNIIHRHETNTTIEKAARIMKNNKIVFEIDHILGFPCETEADQIEAAKFYNKIRPDMINCYWLKCFPKTEIIEFMLRDNKLTEEDVKKIEAGFGPSYISGGSVKDVKKLKNFISLFNIIPLFPEGLVDKIIKYRLYYLANFGKAFMVASRTLKSLFLRDIRLLEFLSFYKHYALKLK